MIRHERHTQRNKHETGKGWIVSILRSEISQFKVITQWRLSESIIIFKYILRRITNRRKNYCKIVAAGILVVNTYD
jgi:hypothetical protein